MNGIFYKLEKQLILKKNIKTKSSCGFDLVTSKILKYTIDSIKKAINIFDKSVFIIRNIPAKNEAC